MKGHIAKERAGDSIDVAGCASRLVGKVEAAKAYLRARGKYIGDLDCAFRPTPSADRFSIIERYGLAQRN